MKPRAAAFDALLLARIARKLGAPGGQVALYLARAATARRALARDLERRKPLRK